VIQTSAAQQNANNIEMVSFSNPFFEVPLSLNNVILKFVKAEHLIEDHSFAAGVATVRARHIYLRGAPTARSRLNSHGSCPRHYLF
jgi:hypothetical protein